VWPYFNFQSPTEGFGAAASRASKNYLLASVDDVFLVSWLLFANRSNVDLLKRIRVPILIGTNALFFTRLSSVRREMSSAAAAGFLPIRTFPSSFTIYSPRVDFDASKG
jgi:hypothetical protein